MVLWPYLVLVGAVTLGVARRSLAMLDAAETLTDLLVPLGNRLEKLTGDRAGAGKTVSRQGPAGELRDAIAHVIATAAYAQAVRRLARLIG
jgi:hypothetical protein